MRAFSAAVVLHASIVAGLSHDAVEIGAPDRRSEYGESVSELLAERVQSTTDDSEDYG